MTRHSVAGICCSLLVVALALGGLPAQAQSRPAAGRDTIVIGTAVEPARINPFFPSGLPTSFWEILPVLFTIDVQRDAAWHPFAQGVEYLPSVGDGTWKLEGARMTLAWKIRARNWHDGRPVTCADYVFTHRLAHDSRVGPRTASLQELTARISNVSCPQGAAGREVAVTWKERYAYANLTVIGELAVLPRHLVEPLYRASPSALARAAYGNDAKSIVGDGPYRLVEWEKGASLTVAAVAGHPIFGTPRIRRIIWRFIPDTSVLVAGILSGTIDVTYSIDFDQALDVERKGQDFVQVIFAPSTIWEHIDFNLDGPLLQDVRVRRAIAHAVNRTQIVQQLFAGKQPVAHSYLPPRHPGYTENVPKYSHDPARARALLQEAGFSPGADGIMRDLNGRRLALEINSTSGNQTREHVEQIIQEQLRQVGIDVTILNFPPRVLFIEYTGRRRFKGLLMYAWALEPTFDCNLMYTSDGIPAEANQWVGYNYAGYRNSEMDLVCKAASAEVDETTRNRLLRESAQIFSRDLPALPLYFRVSVGAAKSGLRNFVVSGLPDPDTWNAHQWYWE